METALKLILISAIFCAILWFITKTAEGIFGPTCILDVTLNVARKTLGRDLTIDEAKKVVDIVYNLKNEEDKWKGKKVVDYLQEKLEELKNDTILRTN